MAIEVAGLLLELVDDGAGVGVEEVDEALQYVQVEGGSDQLAVGAPFLTWRAMVTLVKLGWLLFSVLTGYSILTLWLGKF